MEATVLIPAHFFDSVTIQTNQATEHDVTAEPRAVLRLPPSRLKRVANTAPSLLIRQKPRPRASQLSAGKI